MTLIPIGVWLVGVGLYSISAITFWSALAYVAVFHFMRQQYGFMRLYSRNDRSDKLAQWSSTLVIYLATLYPVIYWHSHQPRNFHWFIDGDFVTGLPAWVSQVTGVIYIAAALFYFVNEFKNAFSNRQAFNVPKNVLIVGTMASWYFGIVHFNGDMAFTVTNIVSHGIPYMALVWLYGERQTLREDSPRVFGKLNYSVFFSKLTFPLFIGVLLILAYIEEGLWAGFVWRDHLSAFGPLAALPPITAPDTLTWLIPLLTLPQATHYVLDGFIWRMKDSDANWQKVLFRKGSNV
ncbi:MAG: hypothetical protein EOP05_19600 [Proteobacteria bacterium]|nr:MAG: hypothetical protein EOP05_19600 [Pseudomonadota bacterium]